MPTAAPSIWTFLRPHLWRYRWHVGAALCLNAFQGVAISFQNLVPKYLIDDVLLAPGLDNAHRYAALWKLCTAYVVATVFARMLVWHVGFRLFTYVREKIMFALRADFFRHVNYLCLRFHHQHHSGELFSYLFGSPLQQIQTYFQQYTIVVPGSVFMLVSTLIWIGAWDPMLTGILVVLVLLNVLLMQRAKKRIQVLHEDFQSTETTVSGHVADILRGSRDVKLYVMEDRVISDFQDRVWQIGRKAYVRDTRSHVEHMKQEATSYVCFALLCAACAWRYLHDQAVLPMEHRVTIGQIQGYLISFIGLQQPLASLFMVGTARGAAQAGLNRLTAVLNTASTTPDPVSGSKALPPRGEIEFRSVCFEHATDQPVLKDLQLTIPYGQKVAMVGPSGAGKSTVAQLLLRFYDPVSGSVCVGGVDLRECSGPEIRRSFAVVPQDAFIFRTTIRENLSVARPDATEEQIIRACHLANAWEFISRLPLGLDTPVGESGATLSGGQKQRLAIARALLAEHDFFIFDEATSALDTVSERLIHEALGEAMRGRTALVIAHRLATVQSCDRILVMQEGRIVQDGTYQELVARPGTFQDLVHGQVLQT